MTTHEGSRRSVGSIVSIHSSKSLQISDALVKCDCYNIANKFPESVHSERPIKRTVSERSMLIANKSKTRTLATCWI